MELSLTGKAPEAAEQLADSLHYLRDARWLGPEQSD